MKNKQHKIQPENLAPRDRILLVAHDLFYREGIRATGIDRIIAESSVSKVTFYRQFPSKNVLVISYLQFRHEIWMSWFHDALKRHIFRAKSRADMLVGVMREWFENPEFRGCAFINLIAEFDGILPEAVEIVRAHKLEMSQAIENVLADNPCREKVAFAVSLAIDGAIVHAQYEPDAEISLGTLRYILQTMNLE